MTLESFLLRANGRCKHCLFHVDTQGCRCPGGDYAFFAAVLRQHVRADGTVSQNDCREHLRTSRLKSAQISRFYQLAQAPGPDRLLEKSGTFDDSTDTRGKNRHKTIDRYIWLGIRSAAA